MEVCKSLVGGRPVAGAMPSIDKRYPATGEVIARIEPADQTILDQAVEVAAAVPRAWGARRGSDRAAHAVSASSRRRGNGWGRG